MNTIKKGTLLPQIQDEVYDFDPSRGYLHHITYKGADQNQMLALQQDYARSGISCRLIFHQGDTASLQVEDASQQFTIDTWQIVGNVDSTDILNHPGMLPIYSAAPDMAAAVKNAAIESENGALDSNTITRILANDALKTLSAAQKTFLGSILALRVVGQSEYRNEKYVLRHTTNAPARWNVNVSDVGVGHIYTQAQLLTETQNAGLWVYPLPGRLAYKLASIPTPTAQPGYLFGWYKGGSIETTAANFRIEINTEYVLDQWSTTLYPPF